MFVGRKKELQYLEENFAKEQNSVFIIYGHKGVGKTSLCLLFASNKNSIYYAARDCSDLEQLYLWNNESNLGLSEAELSFDNIFNSLPFGPNGKRILIIDEYQNIIKNSNDFFPALMNYVKDAKEEIMVLLCSSSISFVENGFVPKIGSYAAKINGFLKVPELKFSDLCAYFKKYDTIECMEVYSLLGGMPIYWSKFTDSISVRENIERAILHPDSYLRDEGLRIVSEELRELNVYCTLLNCLANGMNKLNELHVHTGYSRAKISVYIKNLMERELVEKVFSFDNAFSLNAKKGVYRLKNHYLAFYFRFMFKNLSKLNLLGAKKFYETCIGPYIDSFHQNNFRNVCSEYMEILNQKGKLPIKATRIGEWVGKNGNIDIVMQNEDWDNILCFCNWDKPVFTQDDYNKCLKVCEDARLKDDYVLIFSKGAFDERLVTMERFSDKIQLVDVKTL